MMMHAELLVVGAGMAGAMAAARAKQRGLHTMVCSRPGSATAMSSGAIELAPNPQHNAEQWRPQPHETLTDCVTALARREAWHPYAQIGAQREGVDDSIDFLRALVPDIALQRADDGGNMRLASSLGLIRQVALAPQSMARGDLSQLAGARIAIADFAKLSDFDGRAMAASLRACSARLDREYQWVTLPLTLPFFRRHLDSLRNPIDLAGQLDDPVAMRALAASIAASLTAHSAVDLLLVPPIMGLQQHPQQAFLLQALAGLQVAESPGLFPSPPGLRLQHALDQGLQAQGVERINNQVVALNFQDPQRILVSLQDQRGVKQQLSAERIILATGHLAAAGLVVHGATLREPIAELPLFCDGLPIAQHQAWSLLGAKRHGPQALLRTGLLVDDTLRPLRQDGQRPVHPRLFAAGAVLAGNDPVTHRAGLGLAALTGFLAGKNASQV